MRIAAQIWRWILVTSGLAKTTLGDWRVSNVVESFVDQTRRVRRLIAKRRWLVLTAVVLVAGAGMAALSLVQERYRASARIYVDTQTALRHIHLPMRCICLIHRPAHQTNEYGVKCLCL